MMQMKSKMMWVLPFILILNVSLAQSFPKDSIPKTLKITIPYQWTSVFSWGFKVNLNTTFRNYDEYYFNNRATYSVNTMGFASVVEWQFLRHLSIGIEPTYVRNLYDRYKASNESIEPFTPRCGNGLPQNIAFYTNYFALPIMLKARFPVFKNKALISSEIGWSSQLLVANSVIKNTNVFEYEGYEEFVKSSINKFDQGLNVGIGLSIPLKKGFIDVNTRYYTGGKDVTQLYDSKTQILTYQLGYRFIL